MRILWSIHLYPPTHNCGAEYVAHHVNKWLISQGHQVRVMLLHHFTPYEFEGVEVVPYPHHSELEAYQWADVVFTHLDYTRHTINICSKIKRPVVHFMHNDGIKAYECIRDARYPQYMVYNSEWLAGAYQARGFHCPYTVLQPPCPYEYYSTGTDPINGEYITLINCNENKGGYLLHRIAQAMPHKKFLAVKGSYDDGGLMPDIVAKLTALPNVTVVDHKPNVREVYQQTRTLLVLSRYESWGRVATEAMASGIPVIYTSTNGLDENVGPAGIQFSARPKHKVDRGEIVEHDGDTYNIEPIIHTLNRLDNETVYRVWSEKGKERYSELLSKQSNQLYELHQLIDKAKQDYKSITDAGSRKHHGVIVTR